MISLTHWLADRMARHLVAAKVEKELEAAFEELRQSTERIEAACEKLLETIKAWR